jgi:hypothetical protein
MQLIARIFPSHSALQLQHHHGSDMLGYLENYQLSGADGPRVTSFDISHTVTSEAARQANVQSYSQAYFEPLPSCLGNQTASVSENFIKPVRSGIPQW